MEFIYLYIFFFSLVTQLIGDWGFSHHTCLQREDINYSHFIFLVLMLADEKLPEAFKLRSPFFYLILEPKTNRTLETNSAALSVIYFLLCVSVCVFDLFKFNVVAMNWRLFLTLLFGTLNWSFACVLKVIRLHVALFLFDKSFHNDASPNCSFTNMTVSHWCDYVLLLLLLFVCQVSRWEPFTKKKKKCHWDNPEVMKGLPESRATNILTFSPHLCSRLWVHLSPRRHWLYLLTSPLPRQQPVRFRQVIDHPEKLRPQIPVPGVHPLQASCLYCQPIGWVRLEWCV